MMFINLFGYTKVSEQSEALTLDKFLMLRNSLKAVVKVQLWYPWNRVPPFMLVRGMPLVFLTIASLLVIPRKLGYHPYQFSDFVSFLS